MYQLYDVRWCGTYSAVHTSTAARVPRLLASAPSPPSSTLMAVHKAASPTRVSCITLSHSLSHSLWRCGLMHHPPPGLWAKCLRWLVHYQCTRQLMYTKHRRQSRPKSFLQTKKQKNAQTKGLLLRDGDISFLVWLQTTGAAGSPPRK